MGESSDAVHGGWRPSTSSCYVLENEQGDTYADRDTVPLTLTMDHVADIIAGRQLKPDGWYIDR